MSPLSHSIARPLGTELLQIPEVQNRMHRISLENYHRLSESGVIAEKTELIRGLVVDKMTISPRHAILCQFMFSALYEAVGNSCHVRFQLPLPLSDSEPEPDLAVVAGAMTDYGDEHPSTAAFVIEVAISPSDLDRKKADIYAEAGIPEYWNVLGDEQQVDVYRSPKQGKYQETSTHRGGETLTPAGFPKVSVVLNDLFAL
ncbi:MAG: Uma2 family endonuclease [Planctomycetales bacterium]|nr:Uma2 family endonuclease [Planctomycetales bacterium]